MDTKSIVGGVQHFVGVVAVLALVIFMIVVAFNMRGPF